MEGLEAENILRNQQVASSILAGGSNLFENRPFTDPAIKGDLRTMDQQVRHCEQQ